MLTILRHNSKKLTLQLQPHRVERIWHTLFAVMWTALFLFLYISSGQHADLLTLVDPQHKQMLHLAPAQTLTSPMSVGLIRMTASQPTFEQKLHQQVNAGIGLPLILGSGLWLLAPALRVVQLDFDKGENRLRYRCQHLLSRQMQQYALDELERVELRRYLDHDDGNAYFLALIFEQHPPLVVWEEWDAETGKEVLAVIQEFLSS
ncbi:MULTISPECIES: hypothetical protein [Leptolyngbya]|uniref:hypothetical protein n=1 Tax=Leptolyngbya TaxID=47251 RepID=UPI0016825643|nr:hypothetical protein [Leptolyngbya sp. FACHB-1624]MBD1854548.1 hypothetical protein [Leptolyngbya sp. FACHB-1624]